MKLSSDFADFRKRRDYCQRIGEMIGQSQYNEAEAQLRADLAPYPSALAQACLNLRPHDVQLDRWDDLQAAFIEAEEDLRSRSNCCAVVAVDVVNRRWFGDRKEDELHLETKLYGSPPELDLTKAPERLIRCASRSSELRSWRGSPAKHGRLGLLGLDQIAQLQRAPDGARIDDGLASTDYIARVLSDWFIHLHVNRALERELQEQGLPRPAPVLCGTDTVSFPMEHNVRDYWEDGERYESLHFAREVPALEERLSALLSRRTTERNAASEKEARKFIDGYIERRENFRNWTGNPRARAILIPHLRRFDSLISWRLGIKLEQPTWEMNDRDFEVVIRAMEDHFERIGITWSYRLAGPPR